MSEQKVRILSSQNTPSIPIPWWVRFCRVLWKITAFFGTAVILGLVVNVFSTWLTSPKGVVPADSPFGWLLARWPIALIVGCSFLLLALLIWLLSRWPTNEEESDEEQNRAHMLKRLRGAYHDLLTQSLQGAAWLELGFAQKKDAVKNASTLLLRQANQPERLLPAGTSIKDAYEEAGQELLILGEPGAGKSTLLLNLAQHLVEQAEHDASQPLPFILPLSSWAAKRSLLQDWLAEQMTQIYEVPRSLAPRWIKEGEFLPLLDGLDEMEENARLACIASINTYHRTHLAPIVVCSRRTEYESAADHEKLTLQNAVVVQPLTREQVDDYLIQAGKPLDALHNTLKQNPALQELATTPLWLSVMMLTYHGASVHHLSAMGTRLQQQVLADYVQRMVNRKGDAKRYPLQRTLICLGWLARLMRSHNQPIFYLEDLRYKDRYPVPNYFTLYQWSTGLVAGLVIGFRFGPVAGLVVELVVGLLFQLFFGSLSRLNAKLEPEVLTLSWKTARFSLIVGLIVGLIVELIVGLLFGLFSGLVVGLIIGSLFGLIVGTIVGMVEGLSKRPLLTLNESMQRSAKSELVVGLLFGLVAWLLFGLLLGLAAGQFAGLIITQFVGSIAGNFAKLAVGLLFGMLIGRFVGWNDFFNHFTLRIYLWRSHIFPWRGVEFLKDATTRILLQRVGSGYSFIHRLLLDYFADRVSEETSVSLDDQTQDSSSQQQTYL